MKTKKTTVKNFHAVAFFRRVKEQMAKELEGKTFEQQKKLLRQFLSGEIKLKVSE